jgi:N-methylhydantoinase B
MEGSVGSLIMNPDTPEQKKCQSKGVDQIMAGDLLSIRLPGSGGYGSPVERDPEAVQWDVINGKISMASAQKDYRVVFDEEMRVDTAATETLRKETHEVKNERRFYGMKGGEAKV